MGDHEHAMLRSALNEARERLGIEIHNANQLTIALREKTAEANGLRLDKDRLEKQLAEPDGRTLAAAVRQSEERWTQWRRWETMARLWERLARPWMAKDKQGIAARVGEPDLVATPSIIELGQPIPPLQAKRSLDAVKDTFGGETVQGAEAGWEDGKQPEDTDEPLYPEGWKDRSPGLQQGPGRGAWDKGTGLAEGNEDC